MENETLNIDYHTCRLIVKALNSVPSKVLAAQKVGISERNLYRKIRQYEIGRVGSTYVSKFQKQFA